MHAVTQTLSQSVSQSLSPSALALTLTVGSLTQSLTLTVGSLTHSHSLSPSALTVGSLRHSHSLSLDVSSSKSETLTLKYVHFETCRHFETNSPIMAAGG